MNRDDIIRMAREAGLYHFYDSEGHCDGITDARLVTEDKERDDDRMIEMLAPFAALVAAAERERIIAQNAPEIEKINAHIKALETDPALHFCHRFAILMESMLLSNDSNLDKYWDEAHALLGEYHKAQEWWQHQMGEPYVSGFGKD